MARIVEYPFSHPAMSDFQIVAAKMTSRTSREPIERIVGVGVPFTRHGWESLRDRSHIHYILSRLDAANLALSPNAVFVPIDLNHEQDFLDPKNAVKADVLAFEFIAGKDYPERKRAERSIFHFIPRLKKNRPFIKVGINCFRESPFDLGIESWKERTLFANPKIIVARADCPEIIQFGDDLPGYVVPDPSLGLNLSSVVVRKDYMSHLSSKDGAKRPVDPTPAPREPFALTQTHPSAYHLA